jgi:hypothetical protein
MNSSYITLLRCCATDITLLYNRHYTAVQQTLHCCTTDITLLCNRHYTAVQQTLQCCTTDITLLYNRHYTAVQQTLHYCTTDKAVNMSNGTTEFLVVLYPQVEAHSPYVRSGCELACDQPGSLTRLMIEDMIGCTAAVISWLRLATALSLLRLGL